MHCLEIAVEHVWMTESGMERCQSAVSDQGFECTQLLISHLSLPYRTKWWEYCPSGAQYTILVIVHLPDCDWMYCSQKGNILQEEKPT